MNLSNLDNLSVPQLLELLRVELPLPEPSFFPVGVAWIGLGIILTLIFVYKVFLSKYKESLDSFLLKKEFNKISNQINNKKNRDNQKIVLMLSGLLRRVGVVVFGYEKVAELYSQTWAEFLIKNDKAKTMTLNSAKILAMAPYLGEESFKNINLEQLYTQTYNWAVEKL